VVSLAEPMQATLTDGAIVGCGVSTKLPLGVEIGAHGGGALSASCNTFSAGAKFFRSGYDALERASDLCHGTAGCR
jgi:hypothetical protein